MQLRPSGGHAARVVVARSSTYVRRPIPRQGISHLSEVHKAVVTGASGLIGSQLVQYLVASGADVVAIDKVSAEAPGARVVQLDLCRRSEEHTSELQSQSN